MRRAEGEQGQKKRQEKKGPVPRLRGLKRLLKRTRPGLGHYNFVNRPLRSGKKTKNALKNGETGLPKSKGRKIGVAGCCQQLRNLLCCWKGKTLA